MKGSAARRLQTPESQRAIMKLSFWLAVAQEVHRTTISRLIPLHVPITIVIWAEKCIRIYKKFTWLSK
jgi:hypothetical protein